MGMIHSHGDTQDFEARLSKGEFIRIGFDDKRNPLYMLAETLHKPFRGLSLEQSRILHSLSRKGGGK